MNQGQDNLARGFLGAGDVYLRVYGADGKLGDWMDGGEAQKFEIKVDADIKEQKSKGRNTYGQTFASVMLPKATELSLEFSEVHRQNLALALQGHLELFQVGVETVADETVTVKLGAWIPLAKPNLLAEQTVVKNATDKTYALDVDYVLNTGLGWIKPLQGGSMTDKEALKVSYKTKATEGVRLLGGTNPQLRCQVKFDGKNYADGTPCQVDVFEAVLTPDGAFDFLKSDWGDLKLKGRMNTPRGKSSAFVVSFVDK